MDYYALQLKLGSEYGCARITIQTGGKDIPEFINDNSMININLTLAF